MKDYSLNDVSAKEFILNYLILNNNLIINYATGEVKIVPYSIELEKGILEKMKHQVVKSNTFSCILNNKFEIFFKLFIDSIFLFVLFIVAAVNFKISAIVTIISSVIFPIVIGLTGYKLWCYQKIRTDIKKQRLFLNNEESLNLTIRNNPKVIEGLDEKIKEKVTHRESNNFSFTINTIDRMEYKKLQQVYRHVDKIVSKNKAKTLERRINDR